MSLIRMRALQRFRLKPGGPWIAKGAILHLAPRKARTMQKRGHLVPLSEDGLEQMEPGWYPKEDAKPDPCSRC